MDPLALRDVNYLYEKGLVMKYVGIAVTVLIIGIVAFATIKKVSPVDWGWWGTTNTSSGVALHGHDPVGYFDQGGRRDRER